MTSHTDISDTDNMARQRLEWTYLTHIIAPFFYLYLYQLQFVLR